MTQNVKKPGRSSLAGRSLAALLLLALGAVWSAAGCSQGNSNTGSGSNDGSAGACTGADCHKTPGRFTACKASTECDSDHGFSCVDGTCSYECESHNDCVEVGHCEAKLVDGAHRNFCVADDTPPEPGKLYTSCPNGTECADTALCIGAGPGDLDAYCSVDCTKDDDCAAGYYCGSIGATPCGAACKDAGDAKDPSCVPAAQIGSGQTYHCGPAGGVQRSVCRQREFCSVCATDTDCLAVPNQICALDQSGGKICTRLCDPSARSCPWGNAATCGLFDDSVGAPTCSHKFGSCHGTGQTCEPCRNSADCPGGACTSSNFTGERWCVNLSTKCECPKVDSSGVCDDGGCPDSPSGLPLQCIGTPKSQLFDLCYAANSGSQTLLGASPQTGCWGPN